MSIQRLVHLPAGSTPSCVALIALLGMAGIVQGQSSTWDEEQFGPVLPAMPFGEVDAAIALANATDRIVEVAPVVESTTIGAAFTAGLGIGVWSDLTDIENLWSPAQVVGPAAGTDHAAIRLTWHDALKRAGGWIPDLSGLDF